MAIGIAAIGELAIGEISSGAAPPGGGATEEIDETLVLVGATLTQVDTVLAEVLALTDEAVPHAKMVALISDVLALQDVPRSVLEGTVAEVLALTGTLEDATTRYAEIVDTLLLSGTVETTIAAMGVIAEVLALQDTLRSVHDLQLTDSTAFTEAVEAKLAAYEALVASVVFADSNVGTANVTVLVNDSFVLNAAVDPRVSLVAAIHDGLDFAVGFVFDDTPYVAFSMTTATKALTTYSNFAFDSMASFNGRTYAAGDGGLYRLGGDTDAGEDIVWRLRTGLSNLGTGRNKGLDAVYLGHTATGRVALKCIVVKPSGEKAVYWYELTPSGGAAHGGRILTGRGLRSVYWGFELTNVDAGDIELDVVELHPVVFEGRVP